MSWKRPRYEPQKFLKNAPQRDGAVSRPEPIIERSICYLTIGGSVFFVSFFLSFVTVRGLNQLIIIRANSSEFGAFSDGPEMSRIQSELEIFLAAFLGTMTRDYIEPRSSRFQSVVLY